MPDIEDGLLESVVLWADEESCQELLRACAIAVERRLAKMGVGLDAFGLTDSKEIEGELYIFFSSMAPDSQRSLIKILQDEGMNKFAQKLANWYINTLLDKRRTFRESIWHSKYRHIRQLLSEAKNINYKTDGQKTLYSIDNLETMPEWISSQENFRLWKAPPENIGPYKKEHILILAEYFYSLVKFNYGSPCWVPIKELTNYILAWFDTSTQIDDPPYNEPFNIDLIISYSSLSEIVMSISRKLKPKERQILYLKHQQNLSMKEIAAKVKLKTASAVKYHIDNAYEKIREVCIQWPGLSPDSLDNNLFDLFWDKLMDICKTLEDCRQTQ